MINAVERNNHKKGTAADGVLYFFVCILRPPPLSLTT